MANKEGFPPISQEDDEPFAVDVARRVVLPDGRSYLVFAAPLPGGPIVENKLPAPEED